MLFIYEIFSLAYCRRCAWCRVTELEQSNFGNLNIEIRFYQLLNVNAIVIVAIQGEHNRSIYEIDSIIAPLSDNSIM